MSCREEKKMKLKRSTGDGLSAGTISRSGWFPQSRREPSHCALARIDDKLRVAATLAAPQLKRFLFALIVGPINVDIFMWILTMIARDDFQLRVIA